MWHKLKGMLNNGIWKRSVMKKAWHIFEEQLNSCSTKAGMLCVHKNMPTLSVCQSELVLEK